MDNKVIKSRLIRIQKEEKEPYLFPILKQLFSKMQFEDVRINHGNREFGKDLVFYETDKFNKKIWYSVVVKNKNATQSDFENGGEVLKQVETSFKKPYKDENKDQHYINRVIVIINGSVTPQALEILEDNIERHFVTNVEIWNYQRLGNEIEKHIKNEFISNSNGEINKQQITINVFKSKQIESLSDIRNSKELFQGLDLKDIDDIYVNAKTTYAKFENKKKNYNYNINENLKKTTTEFDEAKIILNSNKNFIIHGIAASGKSLLLRRIGIKGLNDDFKNSNVASFFIELRKFNKEIKKFKIDDIINTQYNELTHGESFNKDVFKKIILLFDGLDEIRSDEEKIKVLTDIWYYICDFEIDEKTIENLESDGLAKPTIEALKTLNYPIKTKSAFTEEIKKLIGIHATKDYIDLIVKYSRKTENKELRNKFQIIISSRSIELIEDNDLLTSFEKIELLPFDIGQAFKLIKKIIPGNKIKATNFINAIKHSQLSNSLTRTPMALTLTAILYRDGEIDLTELPANITELYNKFTDYYLNRWDASKGLSLQYKYEEAKNILAFIAEALQTKGIQEISEKDLISFLQEISENYPYEDLKNIPKFIDELKNRVGLIQFNEYEKTFKFYHLSFQEYFTSIYFSDDTEQNLINDYLIDWWENTIIFYCGKQPKRDVFIKKVMKTIVPIDGEQHIKYLSLTSKCVQASHLIPKTTQKNIIQTMIYRFEQMYKLIISDKKGPIQIYSTLEIIMQLRDFFYDLFDTKHIYSEMMNDIVLEILTSKENEFSLTTLYALSYFMSTKTKDPIFLEEFLKQPNLDNYWNRIVFTDVTVLRLNDSINKELYNKIKKIQKKKQKHIQLLFKQPATMLSEIEEKKLVTKAISNTGESAKNESNE